MNLKGTTANAKVINLMKALNDQFYIAETYRNGHYLIKNKKETYYVVFKKAYYNTFNREFSQNSEKADSINLEAINRAVKYDAKVLIIHDEKIYQAFPMQIKNYCENKGFIRKQLKGNLYLKKNYSGTKEETHEITYSFPLEPMERSIFNNFDLPMV